MSSKWLISQLLNCKKQCEANENRHQNKGVHIGCEWILAMVCVIKHIQPFTKEIARESDGLPLTTTVSVRDESKI